MNMGGRIEQRLKELGWRQVELLSRVPELSTGTLSALIARDSKRSEFAARIADALGVTLVWLLDGKEPKEIQMVAGGDHPESNAEPAPRMAPPRRIPVVGTAQLGDNGFWAELEYPVGHGDGYILLPTRDTHAYALRCRGNSMRPRIRDGEYVVVEPGTPPIPGDEVLVRATDGRVMVKTLLYRRDGRVHLLSVNEAHPPVALEERDIEVIHPVTAIVKKTLWVPE